MKLKNYLMLSLLLFSMTSAIAAPAETVTQALKKCGQVQNSLKRLVCYDKMVNELNRYGGLNELMSVPAPLAADSAAPAISANTTQADSSATTPEPARNTDFGIEHKIQREDSEDKIYATVVKIEQNARKKRVFTLDNGHVWRQTEGNSLKIDINDLVYVERGALGSFHLSKDNVNRRMRVKRVK
jgi:hypothetical protein